jgi:hypothetical protein
MDLVRISRTVLVIVLSCSAYSCHCSTEMIGDAGRDPADLEADHWEIPDSRPEAVEVDVTDTSVDPGPDARTSCDDVPIRTAGDINGDGFSDLVVSGTNGTALLFGKSGFPGTVEFPSMLLMYRGGSDVEICDIDGDCHWDVVIRNNEDPGFSVILGSSISAAAGGPLRPDMVISIPGGTDPSRHFHSDAACVGDLDGDGYHDLAIGTANSFALIYGRRDFPHEFELSDADAHSLDIMDPVEFEGFSVGGIGDYDGDGLLDVAVSRSFVEGGQPTVHILLGWGRKSGSVGLEVDSASFTISTEPFPNMVSQVGDVNNDDLSDFLVCSYYGWVTCYLVLGRSDPRGTTPPGVDATFYQFGSVFEGGIGIGDWTGDGMDDLLFGDEYNPGDFQGSIHILEGREDWPSMIRNDDVFYASVDCEITNGRLGRSIAAAEDMDGDGFMDIFGLGIPETESDIWVFAGRSAGWVPDSLSEAAAVYTGDRYIQKMATAPPFLWSAEE